MSGNGRLLSSRVDYMVLRRVCAGVHLGACALVVWCASPLHLVVGKRGRSTWWGPRNDKRRQEEAGSRRELLATCSCACVWACVRARGLVSKAASFGRRHEGKSTLRGKR